MDAFVSSIAILDCCDTHTKFCNPPGTEKTLYIVLKKQNVSYLINRQKDTHAELCKNFFKT